MASISKQGVLNSLLVVFFVGLVFGVIGLSFIIKPNVDSLKKKDKDKPDFYFEDVHIIHFVKGEKMLVIHGDRAEVDEKKNYFKINNIKGDIYEDDHVKVLFESPLGQLDFTNNILQLNQTQSILNENDQLMALSFNSLVFNTESLVAKGDGDVKIASQKVDIDAQKITFDIKNEIIYITDSVEARIRQ